MFWICDIRLLEACVQSDPEPEIVAVVPWKVVSQKAPHLVIGAGMSPGASVCGSDSPAKTAASAGSGVWGGVCAEALPTRANPRTTAAKAKLTPRLLVMSAPFHGSGFRDRRDLFTHEERCARPLKASPGLRGPGWGYAPPDAAGRRTSVPPRHSAPAGRALPQ